MSGLEEGSGREKGGCVRKGYRLVIGALRPREKVVEREKKGWGGSILGNVISSQR